MRFRYRYIRHGSEILRTGQITPFQAQYFLRKTVEDARRAKHKKGRPTVNPKARAANGAVLTDLDLFGGR